MTAGLRYVHPSDFSAGQAQTFRFEDMRNRALDALNLVGQQNGKTI